MYKKNFKKYSKKNKKTKKKNNLKYQKILNGGGIDDFVKRVLKSLRKKKGYAQISNPNNNTQPLLKNLQQQNNPNNNIQPLLKNLQQQNSPMTKHKMKIDVIYKMLKMMLIDHLISTMSSTESSKIDLSEDENIYDKISNEKETILEQIFNAKYNDQSNSTIIMNILKEAQQKNANNYNTITESLNNNENSKNNTIYNTLLKKLSISPSLFTTLLELAYYKIDM
jgi:hypothetical protein